MDVVNDILNRVGWLLPYYLQLMFHCLLSIADRERSSKFPSSEDVETAYETATRTNNLGHWSSRLKDLLQPEEKRRAQELLTAIANAPNGLPHPEIHGRLVASSPHADPDELQSQLRKLLRLLSDDGYIVQEDDTIRFRSFLLRDFWKREFEV